jgi:hypothetical protein
MEASTRTAAAVSRKMHQTTVRFGADLWSALESEAGRLGVSVAQYVRDAARSRLSYDAGRRDEHGAQEQPAMPAAVAVLHARDEQASSAALWGQARLQRDRALALRQKADAARVRRADQKT